MFNKTEASLTNRIGFLVLGGRVEESGFNRPGMVAHGETGSRGAPRTARAGFGVRLRLGILSVGEETDTEITGLGGCTRLRLAVGGAKHRWESLWPLGNDSGTLTQLDMAEGITKRFEFTHLSPE